jgi:hypothetical protein
MALAVRARSDGMRVVRSLSLALFVQVAPCAVDRSGVVSTKIAVRRTVVADRPVIMSLLSASQSAIVLCLRALVAAQYEIVSCHTPHRAPRSLLFVNNFLRRRPISPVTSVNRLYLLSLLFTSAVTAKFAARLFNHALVETSSPFDLKCQLQR